MYVCVANSTVKLNIGRQASVDYMPAAALKS